MADHSWVNRWIRRWIVGELSWRRLIASVLQVLGIFYLYLLIYGAFFSDGQIFLPPAASYRDSDSILKVQTESGVEISALWLPHPEARYTLLYSHGNAEDLGYIRPILEDLNRIGFSVLAYDYQGYGTSQGTPSEQGSYQDIDAAYRYLTQELRIPPSRIIAYGRSVGSGPTVDLAQRQPLAGVILESPFVTAFRVLTRIPIVPFDKFANIAKIDRITAPILILHGTEDTTIPIWHGQALYEQARQPKFHLWVEGAGHNDLPQIGGETYRRTLQEFAQGLAEIPQTP